MEDCLRAQPGHAASLKQLLHARYGLKAPGKQARGSRARFILNSVICLRARKRMRGMGSSGHFSLPRLWREKEKYRLCTKKQEAQPAQPKRNGQRARRRQEQSHTARAEPLPYDMGCVGMIIALHLAGRHGCRPMWVAITRGATRASLPTVACTSTARVAALALRYGLRWHDHRVASIGPS